MLRLIQRGSRSARLINTFSSKEEFPKFVFGVPRETYPEERRVAASPDSVMLLVKDGHKVLIEQGAGEKVKFNDESYRAQGAEIVQTAQDVFAGADIVLKVHAPDESQVALLRADQTLVSFLWPAQNKPLIEQIAKKHVNAFGMDCVPRIRRAQTYDALSSMAKIAGYKAVREAAREFGGYFVVDGKKKKKIPPPKVLIIGAGVTGLSAIATAKEYGAIVRVFDTRLAVKEQVKAFCAEFLELNFKDEDGSGKDGYAKEMSKDYIDAEMDLIAEQAMEVDIIITTASIPGRPAPKLITKAMVESMKKGSVIVDLAADRGGNCELTKPGQLFNYNGKVKIIGYTDLPMRVPKMCSQVYANNISKLMQYIIGTIPTATGRIADVDLKDDVVRQSLVSLSGELKWPPPPLKPTPKVEKKVVVVDRYKQALQNAFTASAAILAALSIGYTGPHPEFLKMLNTFVLSGIVGYQVVWGVLPALHSPLMALTNAVSGIIIIGGMTIMNGDYLPADFPGLLAALSVSIASFNIFGGLYLTNKLLGIFGCCRHYDRPKINYLLRIAPLTAALGYYIGIKLGVPFPQLTNMAYIASTVSCIMALRGLSKLSTARMGNALGCLGVSLGVLATLGQMNYPLPLLCQWAAMVAIGGLVGVRATYKQMDSNLHKLVAFSHSLAGLAAVLISIGNWLVVYPHLATDPQALVHKLAIFFGVFTGGVTFTGSLVGFDKLQGLLLPLARAKPYQLAIMALTSLASLGIFATTESFHLAALALVTATGLSKTLGVTLTHAIPDTNMSQVISVLHSCSGWALCATGFMLNNPLLTIVGALVGSSGAILSYICWCKAFFGKSKLNPSAVQQTTITSPHIEINLQTAVKMILNSNSVIIVPSCKALQDIMVISSLSDLVRELMRNGVSVKIGIHPLIHPVAGRMPGQLNVLLSKDEIPYDIVFEMEEINNEFPATDLAIVFGADNTINSAAEDDPDSPIAGMPVLQVWRAKQCIVIKESMDTGYSGIKNPVFYKPNTRMLLGEEKQTAMELRHQVCRHFFWRSRNWGSRDE